MSYNHISHELLIEADHDFEGYSDCERADYGKQNLSFMSVELAWMYLQYEKKKKTGKRKKYRKKLNQIYNQVVNYTVLSMNARDHHLLGDGLLMNGILSAGYPKVE